MKIINSFYIAAQTFLYTFKLSLKLKKKKNKKISDFFFKEHGIFSGYINCVVDRFENIYNKFVFLFWLGNNF